ncbi:MAG: VOC family protein [Bacteriovoracaceae bacterium]|jgi:uncharacterized protein|nr:VOC family protein [Bacteriovoracaceae bacterium]
MSKVNPVGWFEIPTQNIIRAKGFYEKIFEKKLSLDQMNGWKLAWFPKMIEEEYGATGTLIEGDSYVPSHEGSLVYFSVPDIDATLKKIEENGGRILLSKKSIGEHGFIANFEDCEGNRVALHSKT